MMKKLFTLFALLTCFLGANAKEIVDAEVDFSKMPDGDASTITFYGWGASDQAKERLSIKNGCLHFESTEVTLNDEGVETGWLCQFHPIGGVSAEVDVTYTLHFKIKGDHTENVSMLGFGQTPYGQFPITDQWVEGTVDYVCKDASGGNILMQCGSYVGSWDIAYLKITHEGKEEKPIEWIPVKELVNGDAESAWPDWALKEEGGINANWRGDRTKEICAWALTMGRNFDDQVPAEIGEPSDRSRPFPADIEVDPTNASNHVFAAHVTQIDKIDDDNSIAWSNQFWIQAPKAFKNGVDVKVKFRYRADAAATVPSQIHTIYQSKYLNSSAIGSLNFTTGWQTFEGTVTWPADGWSIAFNLTDQNREPNVYYFDDISFEEVKIEEGFFVASANTKTGIEYDFNTATEFVYDADEDAYVATVGTKGKEDTWVNEVMISTVRGYDKYFKGATIKPTNTNIMGNDPDDWKDYAPGSSYKIPLAAGVWQIFIAPDPEKEGTGQILFMQLEGEAPAEPVDIVTNTTEIVINGQERDWLTPDGDGNPREEGGTGTGQTWDNQFFLVANRVLNPDEQTVIEFDYVATDAFNCPTGTHAKPGDYRKNAIPDVEFTTEEKHLTVDYTVPASDWGGTAITDAQSVAFDLAVLKAANTYTIKNVKWYVKGDVNAEGKTMENLIDAEGTANFWVSRKGYNDGKVYQYGTDPTGIKSAVNNIKTNSTAIYNLSGQRVSKDYKGIVIKNGNKYIAK